MSLYYAVKLKPGIVLLSVASLCVVGGVGIWRMWPRIEPAPTFEGFEGLGGKSASPVSSRTMSSGADIEAHQTGDGSGLGTSEGKVAGSASRAGVAEGSRTDLSRENGGSKSSSSEALPRAASARVGQGGIGGYTSLTPEKAREQAEAWSSLFFQTTSVDESTREKLLTVISNSILEDNEIRKVGREQGLSMADISKLRSQNIFRFDQDATAILGPERGKYFIDVYTSEMFVPLAQDFASRCAAQGAPISASTTAAIAINFSRNLRNPDFPQNPTLGSNGIPVNENSAFESAANVLNSTQLDLFKKMWAEHPYPDHPH